MKQLMASLVCLGCLAASASAAEIPELVKQLKDPDSATRRNAAKSLGEAGPDAKEAIPALAAALKDNDLFVRRFAAQSLGEIGPSARSASPDLLKVIKDPKEKTEVLEAAATALGKLGGGAKELATVVKDTTLDASVRRAAVESLGQMKTDAKTALPALLDVLKPAKGKANAMPRGTDFRVEIVRALGDIADKNDKAVVDTLTEMSTDKGVRDPLLKKAIKGSLKSIQDKKPT
jgi:HEAT repeat protein